jgi:uncharacterized repeat protein (TIGR03803 family)
MSKFNLGMRVSGIFLLWIATAVALPAQTITTLHSFDKTGGAYPYAGLILATNGKFYGTTLQDGANNFGTVFKINANGRLTTLHSFNGTDGEFPPRLVQATNGNFYSATTSGGANGCGTVFKITPGGKLTTLHSFDGTNGYEPTAALVQATDGTFYGTTQGGGASGSCRNNGVQGCGIIFKITPGGKLTTLHNFCASGFPCTDGTLPEAALIQATDEKFYGTTAGGGAYNDGTVFNRPEWHSDDVV